jgi:hypothetical protein
MTETFYPDLEAEEEKAAGALMVDTYCDVCDSRLITKEEKDAKLCTQHLAEYDGCSEMDEQEYHGE